MRRKDEDKFLGHEKINVVNKTQVVGSTKVVNDAKADTFTLSTPDDDSLESEAYRDVIHNSSDENLA